MIKTFMLPSLIFNIEHWKWNSEYGLYVSNMGRLKKADGTIVKPKVDKYLYVCSYDGKWTGVHRIVMMTWKPLSDYTNMTVDHLDHNTRNNAVNNLEWVPKEENLRRAGEDRLPVEGRQTILEATANITKTTSIDASIHCVETAKTFDNLQKACEWIKNSNTSTKNNTNITLAAIKEKMEHYFIHLNHGGKEKAYGYHWTVANEE